LTTSAAAWPGGSVPREWVAPIPRHRKFQTLPTEIKAAAGEVVSKIAAATKILDPAWEYPGPSIFPDFQVRRGAGNAVIKRQSWSVRGIVVPP